MSHLTVIQSKQTCCMCLDVNFNWSQVRHHKVRE